MDPDHSAASKTMASIVTLALPHTMDFVQSKTQPGMTLAMFKREYDQKYSRKCDTDDRCNPHILPKTGLSQIDNTSTFC